MAQSNIKIATKHKNGFTLIEVLIALAIVSIALSAIIMTAMHSIHQATYLKQKNDALWLGFNIMQQAQAHLIVIPKTPDVLSDTSKQDSQQLYWEASLYPTANARVQKIIVTIMHDPDDKNPLLRLTGFLYAQ